MTDRDAGITIEMLDASSESQGWAVVRHVAGTQRRIVAAYLTRAHAEAAVARMQEQFDSAGRKLALKKNVPHPGKRGERKTFKVALRPL
jgi:hypothetical protein